MTVKQRCLLLVAAFLSAGAIVLAVIYAIPMKDVNAYRKSIERAELYFSMGDYPQAALEYRRAINADPDEVEAYEGLSDTYIEIGDYDSARNVLEEGYGRTKNQMLYSLIQNLNSGVASRGDAEFPGDKPAENEKASINKTLLNRIGSASYSNYLAVADPAAQGSGLNGSIIVRFSEVPGEMFFWNSAIQPNAIMSGSISNDAIPEEVHLDNISDLTGKVPVTMEELEGSVYSKISLLEDADYGHALQFSAYGCLITIECSADGTVPEGARNRIIPASLAAGSLRDGIASGSGAVVQGVIIDAQTGKGVDDVTLRVRESGDRSGDVLEEVVSDGGDYSLNLPAGDYTVEISGDGYITDFADLSIGENESDTEENFVLSKELESGEIRIVLEWGPAPSDLDSHLIGETDSGTSCHVFFSDRTCTNDEGTVAELDLDDTDSYGPETTTIYQVKGKFDFAVHNYRPETGNLEDSDATVIVYLPGEQPVKYEIGSDGKIEGKMWYVCSIDHGELESY